MEHSERAAYLVLLMHSDWGLLGEKALLGNSVTAIERLAVIEQQLPDYVRSSLSRRKQSQVHLDNIGEPVEGSTGTTADDFDDYGRAQDPSMDPNPYGSEEQPMNDVPQIDYLVNTPNSRVKDFSLQKLFYHGP